MRRTPRPGARVRGSRSGRPIMALLDLLGRRQALRLLWELSRKPCGFRELQALCGNISPSILSTRLRELRAAEILAQTDAGYALTPEGERLLAELRGLHAWAERWAKRR